MTSREVPAAISVQESHTPHGSAVGPFTQFSAFARIRAAVVLPDATRAGKNVSMSYTIVVDSVSECFGDVTLTHKITKSLGAPLAGYNLIGHSFCRTRAISFP